VAGSSPDDFVAGRNKRTSSFPRPNPGLAACEVNVLQHQMTCQEAAMQRGAGRRPNGWNGFTSNIDLSAGA
jgi:hypothetical protein